MTASLLTGQRPHFANAATMVERDKAVLSACLMNIHKRKMSIGSSMLACAAVENDLLSSCLKVPNTPVSQGCNLPDVLDGKA